MARLVSVLVCASLVYLSPLFLNHPLLGARAFADGASHEIAELRSYLAGSQKEISQSPNFRLAQNAVKSPGSGAQAKPRTVSRDDDLLRGPDAKKAIPDSASPRPSEQKKSPAISSTAGAGKEGEGYDAKSADEDHLKLFVENSFR